MSYASRTDIFGRVSSCGRDGQFWLWWRPAPPTICANVPCGHLNWRMLIGDIAARTYAGLPTFLVLGDSNSEIAHWRPMCGLQPVNIGIGSARTDTFLPHARRLINELKPQAIVIALGTGDIISQGKLGPYRALLDEVGGTHATISVPIHKGYGLDEAAAQEANGEIAKIAPALVERTIAETTDGVHLSAKDYVTWMAAIEREVCRSRDASMTGSLESVPISTGSVAVSD